MPQIWLHKRWRQFHHIVYQLPHSFIFGLHKVKVVSQRVWFHHIDNSQCKQPETSKWSRSKVVGLNFHLDFNNCIHINIFPHCYNPNLGFMTNARVCKGAAQEWNSGVIFHAPESAGKCEGLRPHIPKWTPILGVRVLIDSWIFRG
jgi:hypothetical protein